MNNAATYRQMRGAHRAIDDLRIHADMIIEKRKGTSAGFSGTAYVAGNKTTGLGTKAWVRVHLDLGTAEDHDGPPPDPFPPNEEWYEVAQTYGNIHVPRA